MVGEARPRGITIHDWRKHGAEEEHESIRILMVIAMCLPDEIRRVAADLAHVTHTFKHEIVVGAFDAQ